MLNQKKSDDQMLKKIVLMSLCVLTLNACHRSASYVAENNDTEVLEEASEQVELTEKNKYILRLTDRDNITNVQQFLHTHRNYGAASICSHFFNQNIKYNEACLFTQNGSALLMRDDGDDAQGYRVSKLTYIGKNKFYNQDTESYWLLEPYREK